MVEGYLSGVYFGSTVYQWAYFFGAIILGILLGRVASFIAKNYLKKFTEKTKSKFDDVLLEIIKGPMVLVFMILGFFVGSQFLSITDPFIKGSLDNITGVVVIIAMAWFGVRLADALILHFVTPLTKKSKSKIDEQLLPLLSKVTKITIIVFAGIIIMDNFGYNVGALIAGLGIGGIAIAMAAKDTLSNVFGGLTIFADRPFQVGDAIKVGEVEGVVIKVGMRSTRVRDWNKRYITIPNAKVSDSVVINISEETYRRVTMKLGLVYQTSAEKIEEAIKILKQIAVDHPDVEDNEGRVIFKDYGASSLDIEFVYFIRNKKRKFDVMHEVNMEIKKRFEKAGLEFAYPTQTIHVEK